MISTSRMAEVFVDVADVLVSDFDLLDFLHGLAVHTAEITGSSAVGILVSDLAGGLSQVAASSESAHVLELFQLQHSEGPCVDCYNSGQQVIEVDIASSADRWPHFVPRALEAHLTKVHAFPMRLREETLGALNVFGGVDDELEEQEMTVVQALADLATIAILQERALVSAERITEQLQFALNSRIVIEQAKGAVSRALRVGVDEAFEIIRDNARSRRVRLTDLARVVVTDPATMDGLHDRRR